MVIVQVSSGTDTPVSVRGRYFRRIGKTNQRISHEEIILRMILSVGLRF
jgi:predicted HTH transcriptional regulator